MPSSIKRNAIVCNKCETEIESKHRHDMKWCECKAVAVDGGTAYLRRIGNLEDFTDVSEVDDPQAMGMAA